MIAPRSPDGGIVMIDTVILLVAFAQPMGSSPMPGAPPGAPGPIGEGPAAGPGTPVPSVMLGTSLGPGSIPAPLPKIDPKTPLKDLLPPPPSAELGPVYTGEDLSRVPLLHFEAYPEGELMSDKWRARKARTAAAALFLNSKEEDGYLKALVKSRPDLAGVPFVMGASCRTKGTRAAMFKHVAETVVANRTNLARHGLTGLKMFTGKEEERADDFIPAQVAVLRQVMGPGEPAEHRDLVRYLSTLSRPHATRELARLAVFSPSDSVRREALEALNVRRERDYTDVLVEALNYPWPAVARNAAIAIVKLDRKDLQPRLVEMLEEPDPRGPRSEGGKTTARELVRVNHHRSCVLCHAPAESGTLKDDVLVAEVPVPNEPLNPPSRGYGRTGSNLLVRLDVTYLRQDFSVMQAVDEKSAWPTMQRFDFVVRCRDLTAAQAEKLRDRLEKREPGVLSPYQKAAVEALRAMTGRDFEAKAEPWRRFLKLKS
jgi:hypothetical protein